MEDLKKQDGHFDGSELEFQVDYQPRSKADLIKIFMVDNWRSLRGFKKLIIYSLPISVVFLISGWTTLQVFSLIAFVTYLFVVIGYWSIWRHLKRTEYSKKLEAALIKERTFRYGSFGIIHRTLSKNGLSEHRYAWIRFSYLIRWDNFLFLLPGKEKVTYFMLRSDELGEEQFNAFEEFAKSKLPFKRLESIQEIFIGPGLNIPKERV
ncbi:MAG: hypothetical protein AAFN93_23795 [Bacteroidota bacterium]